MSENEQKRLSPEEAHERFLRENERWHQKVEEALSDLDALAEELDPARADRGETDGRR
jgi:uncharacterized protein YukE